MSIDIYEEGGIRYLNFSDRYIQGAMRVKRPNALELAYTREMMAGLLMREGNWPKNALLVGLGAGSLAKFIYHSYPTTTITVVEIDPQVEVIARMHFCLPDDPHRLRIVIGDGAEFMLSGSSEYDYILVDGFDKNGHAGVLDTLPFYQACRCRLSRSGIFAVNLLGRNKGFSASKERISQAFDERSLVFPSCDSGNAIAFGAVGDAINVDYETLYERALALKESTGLNLLPTLPGLRTSGRLLNNQLVL